MKRFLSMLLCVLLTLGLCAPALAVRSPAEMEADAAAACLRERGIMQGDGSGAQLLDRGLMRMELAAILSRFYVNQEHVEAEQEFYTRQCTFTDVPDWAKVHVGVCAYNGLMVGGDDGRFGATDPVTPAVACTVTLRCLGYVSRIISGQWHRPIAENGAVQEIQPLLKCVGHRGNCGLFLFRLCHLPCSPQTGRARGCPCLDSQDHPYNGWPALAL